MVRLGVLSRFLVVLVSAFVLLGSACAKPEPPRITPKEARVTAIGPQGIELLLLVEAVNPNRFTLTAQSFTGKATLDGKWEMGSVTIDKAIVLPPNVPTPIEVPMKLPWTDLRALTALAMSPRPVPYAVQGSAKIGGDRLNVDVPFGIVGTITREQIAAAAMKSLPGAFPPP